jgi:long-chain acyl-CoA synthetase
MLEVIVVGIGIPTAVDGDLTKIVPNLAVVRPTFVAAVPRIFEKVHTKVVTGAQQAGGLKLTIFNWATGVGKQVSRLRQQGQEPSGLLALQFKLADKLVFSKLRELFGGRLRFFVSGSAPLNRDIAEFFHAAGVLILEGYGLTESSAASVVNLPGNNAFGTVGPPLPGTEVKIADDGEILMRSRGIMRGYHNLPEKTAETLDGRWLLTGDIGEFDGHGRLRITDRKKDLIKTSGGKYVAPQALEGKLKSIAPPIGHVIVHGDKRKYCVALITLDPEAAKEWAVKEGIFPDDGEGALTAAQFEQLATDDKAIAMVQGYVDQMNSTLASFETIKQFKLLPRDLQIETGELTPSLKVKRKAVEKQYMALLDTMY